MSKTLYLEVPADLGDALFEEGFDEPYISRSGDLANTVTAVLAVADTVASIGANTVTILVAADQLQALGRRMLAWMRGHGEEGAEMTATIRTEDRKIDLAVKVSSTSTEADTRVLQDFSKAVSTWLEP